MTNSRILKWITGSLELVLAIPILGGLLVLLTGYAALVIMFVLHLITLILSAQNKEPFYGSIVGIITSLLGWIPVLGWLLHVTSAILIMITAAQKSRNDGAPVPPPPNSF